jgi:hypothetical protein
MDTTYVIVVACIGVIYLASECLKNDKINDCIKNVRKKRKRIYKDYDIDCCICFSNIRCLGHLECGHDFCMDCIEKWYERSNTCPVCRQYSKIVPNYQGSVLIV